MKGFVKILESIVASIILLTSLTFFFSTSIKETGWDDTLLQIRAEDVLYTMERNGVLQAAVNQNNATLVSVMLANRNLSMLPPTIEYSLQIDGIPNSIIYVGCLCTPVEVLRLQGLLSPLDFQYKNRNISIRVDNVTLNSIREETNVLFSFGYVDYNQGRNQVDVFLNKGGTLFILGDVTQAQVNDGFIEQTFNVTWDAALPLPSNTASFDVTADPNRAEFKVEKYYVNITNSTFSQSFDFTSNSKIQYNNKTVVISSNGLPMVKINKEILNGHGRTVWFASYDTVTPTAEMLNLTKAVMMWASGESFKLDVIPKTPLTVNIKSSTIIGDAEIYEATITLWNVFQ